MSSLVFTEHEIDGGMVVKANFVSSTNKGEKANIYLEEMGLINVYTLYKSSEDPTRIYSFH